MDKVFDKHGVPIITIFIGGILLVVGLTDGNINISTVSIPTLYLSNTARVIVFLFGMALIVSALVLYERALSDRQGNKSLSNKRSNEIIVLDNDTYKIIYDSSAYGQFDFQGKNSQHYSDEQRAYIGPIGEGTISIEKNGLINIERRNTVGRYDIMLEQYSINGQIRPFISKDISIAGKRKFLVTGEIKAFRSKYELLFVLKDKITGAVPDRSKVIVEPNADGWSPIKILFKVPPEADYYFRIYIMDVAKSPSSVQIKGLKLMEKVDAA
jgi:hypothetical protein